MDVKFVIVSRTGALERISGFKIIYSIGKWNLVLPTEQLNMGMISPMFFHTIVFSVRKCGDLSIENGHINISLPVEGNTATYSCDAGYRLIGIARRVCQRNGLWSKTAPTCQGIHKVVIIL